MQPANRTSESTPASGEKAAAQAQRRQGMLLASPGALYLLIFFVAPLALISVYSFATRTSTGRTSLSGWNVESYRAIGDDGIVLHGFTGSTEAMAPLVRVFAIRFLLGSNGPASALSENLGFGTFRILFTPTAVTIGMVYSFLTFMVLPLYVSLERMDWSLTEAARDLYASGSKAFWKVTLPLTKSGIVAGSVLVFVPSFGSYVVPDILGGAKTLLIGSYIARQFRDARNYPLGAALSVLLIVAMLVAVALNQRSGSGAEGGDRPRRRRRGRARAEPEPAAVS